MPQVHLERHDGHRAEDILGELVGVYAEVYDAPPYIGDPFFAADFYAERLGQALRMPGFEVLTARTATGELAGYAYGVVLPSDRHWWVELDDDCPDFGRSAAMRGDVFWLREIMVRNRHRGHGIGRLLHHRLIAGRDEGWAALTCLPDNQPAHGAYQRWNYQVLGETSHGPGSPRYDAMLLGTGSLQRMGATLRRRALPVAG